MSVALTAMALDANLPAIEKLALIVLADGAGDDGFTLPNLGRLAVVLGLSVAEVEACLVRMEKAGVIAQHADWRGPGILINPQRQPSAVEG